VFDDASFGYRKGRSTKDALRKVWGELTAGAEWIVDADLKDFFDSAC
jgi:RNA-directed DNA polymerase